MITPTLQFLKNKGTTTYTFPSGAEDEAILRTNSDFGMAFTHVVLLNIPKLEADIMNFDDTFSQSSSSIQPNKYSDQLIESLRNYVFNHDTVMRTTKINDSDYYYNVSELNTPTEKIFWKWLKKLNALSLEPANSDEYNMNSSEFNSNGPIGSTEYFKKYLWKERNTNYYNIISITSVTEAGITDAKRILFDKSTNFRIGDKLIIEGVTGLTLVNVLKIKTVNNINDAIIFSSVSNYTIDSNSKAKIKYERIVKAISEINADSSEIKPDGSYQRMFSLIPYELGETPYVLFSTDADFNYKPSSLFPLRNNEVQPEIIGAERSDSVFFTEPTKYPGDWFGQFDDIYHYKTASGDLLKRTGDYFGVTVTNNTNFSPIFPFLDGRIIDGININFNIKNYTYAQNTIPVCNNFTEFSSAIISGNVPNNFEFNAVLWYYDVIDERTGNLVKKKNLYCIQFLDNPDNSLNGDYIPSYTKLVHDGINDGTSYNLALSLQTISSHSEFTPKFDPTRGHDMLNFDLFSNVLKKLADINQVYLNINTYINYLNTELENIKSILGTNPSYDTLYAKMDNMETLLNAYKTLNITSSDSIEAILDTSVVPSQVKLNSRDKNYGLISTINTKSLYTLTGPNNAAIVNVLPYNLTFANNKDSLFIINNNDEFNSSITLSNAVTVPKLEINIEKDLEYKQKLDFIIQTNSDSAYNKGLNININFNNNGNIALINLINNLNLPTNKINTNTIDYSSIANNKNGFNTKNIYYKKVGTNRYFGFEVDLDPRFITLGSKLLINDLKFKINNNIIDASNIYKVSSFSVNKGKLCDLKIIDAGSGYTPNTNRYIWFGNNSSNISKNLRIKYSINSAGNINNADIDFNAGNYIPFNESLNNVFILEDSNENSTSNLSLLSTTVSANPYYIINSNTLVLAGASNRGKFRLGFKTTYNIEFEIPEDSNIISTLDSVATNYSDNDKYYINSLNYSSTSDNIIKLASNPILLPFKGYKIEIIRISNDINILPTEWEKRYKIFKELL